MSKETGVVFEYEQAAMAADEMPDNLEFYDQIMFLNLRMLYSQVRLGIITRETAVKEKRKLLVTYKANRFDAELAKKRVELIKSTEVAISNYRKEKTIENADAIVLAFVGL